MRMAIFSRIGNSRIVPDFNVGADKKLRIRLRQVKELNGCLIVYLKGYFDVVTSVFFQKQVARAIEFGFIKLIVHLRKYDMSAALRSSGDKAVNVFISTFTGFLKGVKPRGGDMVLIGVQPRIYEILQLLGFSEFFNIKKSLSEAVTLLALEPNHDYATFPSTAECPICSIKVEIPNPGIVCCSKCKTLLAIDNTGHVFLW